MFEFLLWLLEGNEKLWLHVVWSSSTKQASFAFDLNVPVLGEKERFAFLLQFSVSYQLSMLISLLQGGNVEIQPGFSLGLWLLSALSWPWNSRGLMRWLLVWLH